VVVSPLKEPGLSLPLPWDDYPYATIGRSLTHPVIHYTMSHFQHGTERVLEELIHRGYRRIGYVEDTYMDQRQDHTAVMVIEHYLRTIPKKNRMDPVIFEGVKFDHLRHWLTTKRPDVVISGSTRIYEMIRDTGVRIPEELGFTTLSWKKQYPECCGIRQRSADLASGAVDLVVAQIHRNERGIPPHAKAMLLEGDWVEGRTLRQ
jgi:DNA-binding LacI/PurR family transcriptional regulator